MSSSTGVMAETESFLRKWERGLRSFFYQNRWLMVVTMLLALGLYYPIARDGLENLDSFCTPEPYWADLWERIPYWETVQGRWALRLWDAAFDGMHPYFLTVLLTSGFFILSAILLCDLLDVTNRWLRFASVSILVCSQYVMNIQTYRYCSVAYAASFFLAILAVCCVQYLPSWRGIVAAVICLTFSLGIYQSSLGVCAAVCLYLMIRKFLDRQCPTAEYVRLFRRLLLMGSVSLIFYLLILKVMLYVYQVSLASINGINQVGIGLLSQLPQGVQQAYEDFAQYFFGTGIAQNYYGLKNLNLVLLILTAVVFLCALVRRANWQAATGAVICMLLLPAAANVTDIINPTTQIALRMAGAMATVPVFCIAVATKGIRIREGVLQKMLVFVLAVLVLRGNILQSNNDIEVLRADRNQAVTIANQILGQISEQKAYQQGAKVAIIGVPASGNYNSTGNGYREKSNSMIGCGLFSWDQGNNRDAWIRLMELQVGDILPWCSAEQEFEIQESDQFKEMPCFPEEGSIAVLQDVLVVKVSD